MREKYVEERFKRYWLFGQCPNPHLVNVAHRDNPFFFQLPLDTAQSIIKEQDACVDMIVALVAKLEELDPVALTKLWYESGVNDA